MGERALRRSLYKPAIGAALIGLLAPTTAWAAELKVFPVRVVLTPADPVQTMTIENAADVPSRVQLRIYEWRQAEGKDVFTETREVLVNPLLFEVGPQGRQIARFGLRTAPGKTEKSYRVFLEEVPGSRPARPGEVQTLLRISIPIFVPADKAEGKLVWRVSPAEGGQVAVDVRNDGDAHVQINGLRLTRRGQEIVQKNLSVYVLPGAAQRILIDAPAAGSARISARDALRIEARTDHGDLSTDIVAEASTRDPPVG